MDTNRAGMVKTDLARDYKTNMLLTLAVNGLMAVAAKLTEDGARTLVLLRSRLPKGTEDISPSTNLIRITKSRSSKISSDGQD